MAAPPGYSPRAASPLAHSPVTADKQEDDRGPQSNASGREAGSSSGSGYPAQLAVANRKQTAKLQAEAQLQNHFKDLENLTPGSSQSCDAKIDKIIGLLEEHKDLAYDVLDMCKNLGDDEKKCKVYVGLSKALGFLPFEDRLGWIFAETLLRHHDALPSEQRNPVKILHNLLNRSEFRINGLRVSDHEKNNQQLEWHILLIPALHRYKDKVFSKSENNDGFDFNNSIFQALRFMEPKDLNAQILPLSSSSISCMKKGDIHEDTKARISEIIYSNMLPIFENLSSFDRVVIYKQLLENISTLIVENRRGEFALKILRPYLSLQRENLTSEGHRHVVEVMLFITRQIPAIPSQKAVWVHRMRALLLGECIHLGDAYGEIALKNEIFKTLSRCRTELEEPTDMETHLSELRKIASTQRNPGTKEMTLRWVDNPQEAERMEQESARRAAEGQRAAAARMELGDFDLDAIDRR